MKNQSNKKFPLSITSESKLKHSSSALFAEESKELSRKDSSYQEDEILLDLSQNLHRLEQKTAFFHFAIQEIIDLVN